MRGEGGRLPAAFGGITATPLPLDESTTLFLIAGLTAERARAEDWFLVFREPMRGTQFGFDSGPAVAVGTWADLTWDAVPKDAGRFVRLAPAPANPNDPPGDPAGVGPRRRRHGPHRLPATVPAGLPGLRTAAHMTSGHTRDRLSDRGGHT